MTTFFLFNNDGLIRAKRVVIDLFSGLLLPLHLFPLWAQSVMNYLPFKGISYIPSMIFTEGFSLTEIMEGLLLQSLWVVILFVPIVITWSVAKRKLVIQGG